MPASDGRKLSTRGVLFALLFVGGAIPLAVLDFLLVRAAPRDGRLVETALTLAVPVVLLLGAAWWLAGRAAEAIARPAVRLSEALRRLARGSFETWVSPNGAVHELAALSEELNSMSVRTREWVRRLERDRRDSAELATDARRLFRQAVEAKESLTKHHPGLLEAYSQAVSSRLAASRAELESSEISLSPFADPGGEREDEERRTEPRFEIGDLVMRAPVGARIVDVSAVGLGLESMERLAPGEQESYELVEQSRHLRIPGRAVWCKLVRTVKTATGDQVPVYRAGVMFVEAFSSTDRDELLEIVQTHRHVA